MTDERSKGEKLMAYGNAAEAFDQAKAELATAKESLRPAQEALEAAKAGIQPAQDAYNAALEALKAEVEALGSDPLKAMKGAKGAKGARGPRDPEKRARVLRIIQHGASVQAIVDQLEADGHTDYEKSYINGVINSLRREGLIDVNDTERPVVYTYTGDVD